jgi:predicted O-methyltransferase YrrM
MIGYSAICLAKGLSEDGVLHTIESREADAVRAMNHFRQAGLDQKIQLHVGNALDILPTITESWDLVFIDADKVNYTQYYSLIKPNLKSGGLLIADNVLFHGEVLRPEIKGKNAKAIQAFNEMVRSDADMETVLLTIRDGLLLMRKK